jgi:hypothetical protein
VLAGVDAAGMTGDTGHPRPVKSFSSPPFIVHERFSTQHKQVWRSLQRPRVGSTIVSFVGDHGWALGEHGAWAKYQANEVATRVPTLIHYPGMPASVAGTSTADFFELVDLWPTVRARPGRLSALRVFHIKSTLYGAFVWARRALNSPKRRFPARAARGAGRHRRADDLPAAAGGAADADVHGGALGGGLALDAGGEAQGGGVLASGKHAKLAHKLAQLQPRTAVFTPEGMGQLASPGARNLTPFSLQYSRPSLDPGNTSDLPALMTIKFMGHTIRTASHRAAAPPARGRSQKRFLGPKDDSLHEFAAHTVSWAPAGNVRVGPPNRVRRLHRVAAIRPAHVHHRLERHR